MPAKIADAQLKARQRIGLDRLIYVRLPRAAAFAFGRGSQLTPTRLTSFADLPLAGGGISKGSGPISPQFPFTKGALTGPAALGGRLPIG